MTREARPSHARRYGSVGIVLAGLFAPEWEAQAQTRWTVDAKSSLAWWQMDPHMNHLWATTCPQEPSWRPGEGGSAAWFMSRWLKSPTSSDTVHVPIYPRYAARDVCHEAVQGEVLAPDTVTWRGFRGQISVAAAWLATGQPLRDEYMRDKILEAPRYAEIRFTIDSVVDVTRHADTLTGSAFGVFSLRGVSKPMVASFRTWPEAEGLRVLARFSIPAPAMVEEYGISSYALGLGVGVRIWQRLFMGADLLLRRN
jgi:hypothetical protein